MRFTSLHLCALLTLLLCPRAAWASFTLADSDTASNGGGATTIATPSMTVGAGDLVFCGASNDSGNTISSITGNNGDTLTLLTGITSASESARLGYILSSAGGTPIYTVTFGASSTGRELQCAAFTPTAAVTFDLEIATAAGISTSLDSGNITTTGADSLMFGYGYNENSTTFTSLQIGGAAADASVGGGFGKLWWKAVGAASQKATGTIGSSNRWLCPAANVKITGGGASAVCRLTLLGAGKCL